LTAGGCFVRIVLQKDYLRFRRRVVFFAAAFRFAGFRFAALRRLGAFRTAFFAAFRRFFAAIIIIMLAD
jgi:hypothetical protein